MPAVLLAVTDWVLVDAVLGNEISLLRNRNLDPAAAVRLRACWREQVADRPRGADGLRFWPVPGRTQIIRLTAARWWLVIAALERWASFDAEDEDWAAAAAGRRIAGRLRTALTGKRPASTTGRRTTSATPWPTPPRGGCRRPVGPLG